MKTEVNHINCTLCNSLTETKYVPAEISQHGHKISMEVRAEVCPTCNEKYYDRENLAEYEKSINEKLDSIPIRNITDLRQQAENYWNGLKEKSTENIDFTEIEKILKNSLERDFISCDYQADVDLLYIRFLSQKSIHGNGDFINGVVYDYDQNNNLVAMEVLDIFGIFEDKEDIETANRDRKGDLISWEDAERYLDQLD